MTQFRHELRPNALLTPWHCHLPATLNCRFLPDSTASMATIHDNQNILGFLAAPRGTPAGPSRLGLRHGAWDLGRGAYKRPRRAPTRVTPPASLTAPHGRQEETRPDPDRDHAVAGPSAADLAAAPSRLGGRAGPGRAAAPPRCGGARAGTGGSARRADAGGAGTPGGAVAPAARPFPPLPSARWVREGGDSLVSVLGPGGESWCRGYQPRVGAASPAGTPLGAREAARPPGLRTWCPSALYPRPDLFRGKFPRHKMASVPPFALCSPSRRAVVSPWLLHLSVCASRTSSLALCPLEAERETAGSARRFPAWLPGWGAGCPAALRTLLGPAGWRVAAGHPLVR